MQATQYEFQSHHDKKLVCCENGYLHNDGRHNGTGDSDSKFIVEPIEFDMCKIRTKYGYLVVNDEIGQVTCVGKSNAAGAVWKKSYVSDNIIAFQGINGRWLSAVPEGIVLCWGKKIDVWEHLTIIETYV